MLEQLQFTSFQLQPCLQARSASKCSIPAARLYTLLHRTVQQWKASLQVKSGCLVVVVVVVVVVAAGGRSSSSSSSSSGCSSSSSSSSSNSRSGGGGGGGAAAAAAAAASVIIVVTAGMITVAVLQYE